MKFRLLWVQVNVVFIPQLETDELNKLQAVNIARFRSGGESQYVSA